MSNNIERALANLAKEQALGQKRPGQAAPLDPGRLLTRSAAASPELDKLATAAGGSTEMNVEALRSVGLAPPADMAQIVAQQFRVIKRPLLLNAEMAEGADANVAVVNSNFVMITSPVQGAGKSFTSMNLALSLASELDWSVLLIDADVNRTTLSRGLGLANAPGLSTLLEEEGELGKYVLNTNLPRLHFLPAGPVHARAQELLASQRMRTLIAELAKGHRRRIVLFDSSPLLLTSEARVLASYAGQIILVVEAGVTPRRSLLDAIELLDPAKAISLVLNKHRPLLGSDDHHYYHASYGAHGGEGSSGRQ